MRPPPKSRAIPFKKGMMTFLSPCFWWATVLWLTFQDIKTTKYFGSFVTPHDIMTSWGEQPEFVLGWDFFFKKLMVQTRLPLHQMFDSIFSPHFATKKPSNSPRHTPKELNHKKGRFSGEKLLANLTKLYITLATFLWEFVSILCFRKLVSSQCIK